MGKKKNNNNNNSNNNDKENANNNNNEAVVEKKKTNDGGGGDAGEKKKKDDKNSSITVVLKVDMHCEGCASKIVKCVRSFEGVETVKAEIGSNKITIVGAVDPSKIRDKLDQKTKKKIDLISPLPKKDNNKDKEPKQETKPKDKSADDDKKLKETPVTTAVLKIGLHCQGCIGKIKKIVSKTKGVIEMSVDKQKETVTVRGTMDTKALTETLKERLKRPVEVIPPQKNKEKENKEANGGGGDKTNNGNGDGKGGDKKNKGGGGGAGGGADGGQEGEGGKMEGNRMEHLLPVGIPGSGHGYGYQPYAGYEYGYPVGGYYHHPVGGLQAPQIFSDENPNACSIM